MISYAAVLLLSLYSSTAFIAQPSKFSLNRHASYQEATVVSQDTPLVLPDFANADEYIEYMQRVSKLPKGFAVGTADGTFVSVEAPGMGNLPIRGTVLHLTDGPTENWAAVFTQNKVRTKPRTSHESIL